MVKHRPAPIKFFLYMSCLVLLVFLRMFEPSITAASSNANYAISQESSKIKNSQSKKDDDSQISVPFETTSVSDEVGTSSDQSTSALRQLLLVNPYFEF
ncbi:hypothetical protein [Ligilactobacillus acidipiscis]|uniref:hypothetical protein n=1 Tax=Ligilactobacillus acidipiscis TaxID=89059 RepID=UPI000704A94C|nr:hypothetical protein [Ligilactobacillus acidipiscis]